jgi:hypothetical protein
MKWWQPHFVTPWVGIKAVRTMLLQPHSVYSRCFVAIAQVLWITRKSETWFLMVQNRVCEKWNCVKRFQKVRLWSVLQREICPGAEREIMWLRMQVSPCLWTRTGSLLAQKWLYIHTLRHFLRFVQDFLVLFFVFHLKKSRVNWRQLYFWLKQISKLGHLR